MGRDRAPCCEKVGLNKGSWTPEEDMRLISYISKHGHGNWRALPKQAGLLRCGKSCRLRWINYLRPDIKRGGFSREEEDTVIKLHELLGNKWSKIASCLPGRTDNEIKNVWNTHLKKRLTSNNAQTPTPSFPSSRATSVSGASSKCGRSYQEDCGMDLILPASSDLLFFSETFSSPPPQPAVHAGAENVDPIDEILSIPIEPELWKDAAEDNQKWLADLEEELGLFCGNGVGDGGEEMVVAGDEGDPVWNYFQEIPSLS